MKLLTFQANQFQWATHSKTLPEVEDIDIDETVEDCVVVFMHCESDDVEQRARVFKYTLKHIKWIAGKAKFKRVVLHSFAHLGGKTGDAPFAMEFMEELKARLESVDFQVKMTPFGYFCSWSIDVKGESMAKVWKSI